MKNFIHGAKWWKFDFHNHTPASMDFGRGELSERNLTCKEWLLEFMKKEIDCIAITDHNSGDWIDTIKDTYTQMKDQKVEGFREVYIFPGVELTVNGGVHLLAILNLDATSSDVSNLIGRCRYNGKPGDSMAVTENSLENVIQEIVKVGGIAIPAHVDKGAGLFEKLLGNTLAQTLKNNRDNLLALELIDRNFQLPDIYNQSKLSLSLVLGSDSHKRSEIGKNFTWVKMSKPSLDALKLALHDGIDGIIRSDEGIKNPNSINNRYFIKSITVTDGFKSGNGVPLYAEFSPWLSSIIGGRGSGKSSLINYLRIALDRIQEMPDEIQDAFDKFNQIGKKSAPGMLRENTKIIVEIFQDGRLKRIIWENKEHKLQTWDNTRNAWGEESKITNINALFPIQIFNQKELYALTGDPSKLIELIDSQFNKQAWVDEKDGLMSKWLDVKKQTRELKLAISEEENLRAKLQATNYKIELYESSEYKETLERFNSLNSVKDFCVLTEDSVSSWYKKLEDTRKNIPTIKSPESSVGALDPESSEFVHQLEKTLKSVEDKLVEVEKILSPFTNRLHEKIFALPWQKNYKDAKIAYDKIEDKLKELGRESYEELLQQRTILQEKLTLIDSHKESLVKCQQKTNQIYLSIIEIEKSLRKKRREVIERWKRDDTSENPFLFISLDPMADVEQANRSFRKLLRKEGSEYSGSIYKFNEEAGTSSGIIGEITNEEEEGRWKKRDELIRNFITITTSDTKGTDLRLARHIEELSQKTPEDLDRLEVWVPDDKLILKFKKHGKYVDIQTGSAGERAAGMLGLLLELNDIPLVIDQPEDDLDTRLISNFVVPGFKTLKENRQLLIVTHNPNIAVNANSENIIYMDFQRGQITSAGNDALQETGIRSAVCDVMEGGKDALNKRYYRISKALS